MGRVRWGAAASLVLLALFSAGCGAGGPDVGSPAAGGPTVTSRAAGPLAPTCRHQDISLATGAFISPATGEHVVAFEVRLRRGTACTLRGTPRVRLLDARRRVMSFRYLHRGLYTSNAPAAAVVVRRGHPGVFLVAKYRCDVTSRPGYPRWARIDLPQVPGSYLLRLDLHGSSEIPLCGKGDPPQDLGTSPIRAGYAALYPG